MTRKQDENVFIIGASGFAVEIFRWLSSTIQLSSVSFVVEDDHSLESPIRDIGCCRESDLLNQGGHAYVAIGKPRLRQEIVSKLKQSTHLKFPNLVHKSAIVDESATLGEGNLILPNTIVCPLVTIGSFSILNLYSSLGHEAKIGDFVTLSPYATLNGKAECKNLVFLGTHSTVGPSVTIGESAKLSANSFAAKDLSDGSLGFGVPAKIRERN